MACLSFRSRLSTGASPVSSQRTKNKASTLLVSASSKRTVLFNSTRKVCQFNSKYNNTHERCFRKRSTSFVPHASSESSSVEEEGKEFWTSFKSVKWDASARSWKTFWNWKLAGQILEADLDEGTVFSLPIKRIALKLPESQADLKDRLVTNLVFYRQNYVLIGVALTLLQSLLSGQAGLVLAVCCGVGSAVCRSSNLLSELQLWLSDNASLDLAWNETRVAGLDRTQLSTGLSIAATLLLAACYHSAVGVVLRACFVTLLWSVAHACFRPLDIRSFGSSVMQDLKEVKSRKDLVKTVGKAFGKFKRMASQSTDPDPFTILNVKGTGVPTTDSPDASGGAGGPSVDEKQPRLPPKKKK